MKENALFLRTIRGEKTERPPVWLMRQAGRILPEYRALRAEVSDFKNLVSNPLLASEATLQPVIRLGVDAAILFSDILVIPEAMGLDYVMQESRGPQFPHTIRCRKDIDQLRSGEDAASHLGYVYEAIAVTNQRLPNNLPLIGFAGAPWTILAYMVEGKGSKTFSEAKRFLYAQPLLADLLLEKITESTIAYLKQQVKAGVQSLQLFDSWAGILSESQWLRFSLPFARTIAQEMGAIPVTLFAKGAMLHLTHMANSVFDVIGIDWNIAPGAVREKLGSLQCVQGNLDPCLLYAPPEVVYAETQAMCSSFGRHHIANLGHGVYPDTPLEAVQAFIAAVKDFRYEA